MHTPRLALSLAILFTVSLVSACGGGGGGGGGDPGPAPASTLFFVDFDAGTVHSLDPDGGNPTILVSGEDQPIACAVDRINKKVYWTTAGATPSVLRADFDGSNRETVFTGAPLSFPNGIALDVASQHIYIAEFSADAVLRMNFDGSGLTTVVAYASTAWPRGVELDLAGGKMYVILQDDSAIMRYNLDGTGEETLLTPLGSIAHDLALDLVNGKIYWVELGDELLRRCDLDGSNPETILNVGTRPRGVAVDPGGGKLYWTKPEGTPLIERSDLDGSNRETLQGGVPLDDPWGIDFD